MNHPSLFDVNVLIAMSWPDHPFHRITSAWIQVNRSRGWATCPITEAGFVRVSSQTAADRARSLGDAFALLQKSCSAPDHVFWPNANSVTQLLPEIRARLIGHKQVTDAILLDLAIRNGGRFVTLDQRVRQLLPAGSEHQSAIVVIPESAVIPEGTDSK